MYFELAWTLLSQRRYVEAAEAFTNGMKLNTWRVSTFFFRTSVDCEFITQEPRNILLPHRWLFSC